VASAIRMDFILSAEIMAITLASVATSSLWMQALVLAVVGVGMSVLVFALSSAFAAGTPNVVILGAVRLGAWKAHFQTQNGYGQPKHEMHDPPLLFHLGRDSSEKRNVAGKHPEVLAEIAEALVAHKNGIVRGTPQLK
jgi:C-terminal region of aryl-sulfatase/Protein of unknown function (DUF808)